MIGVCTMKVQIVRLCIVSGEGHFRHNNNFCKGRGGEMGGGGPTFTSGGAVPPIATVVVIRLVEFVLKVVEYCTNNCWKCTRSRYCNRAVTNYSNRTISGFI